MAKKKQSVLKLDEDMIRLLEAQDSLARRGLFSTYRAVNVATFVMGYEIAESMGAPKRRKPSTARRAARGGKG